MLIKSFSLLKCNVFCLLINSSKFKLQRPFNKYLNLMCSSLLRVDLIKSLSLSSMPSMTSSGSLLKSPSFIILLIKILKHVTPTSMAMILINRSSALEVIRSPYPIVVTVCMLQFHASIKMCYSSEMLQPSEIYQLSARPYAIHVTRHDMKWHAIIRIRKDLRILNSLDKAVPNSA